jgi:hypothetical protein
VGLRWWNEVNASTGDSHWVFESAPQPNEPGGKVVTATDKRFFWLALYVQPALWVALAIVAIFKVDPVWLTLVGMFGLPYLSAGKGLVLIGFCSHGSYSHCHKHSCLFEMRQVQPG